MMAMIWKQGWSREPSTVALWLWLFSMARHSHLTDSKTPGWEGQATITEEQAADALCIGIKAVRKGLADLQGSNFIALGTENMKKVKRGDEITVTVHGYRSFASELGCVGDIGECRAPSGGVQRDTEDSRSIRLKNGEMIDKQKFISFWNEQTSLAHSSMPRINNIMGRRAISLRTAAERFGKQAIFDAVVAAARSPFLNGCNNNSWVASVDWVLKKDNMQKILDGNYSHDLRHDNYEEEMLRKLDKELGG